MEPRRDETDLATELRALRPRPRPEFTAELDARAAAGFAGAAEDDGGQAPNRLGKQLRGMPRWRIPALAGATATVAIVVATTVVAISEDDAVTPNAQRSSASPQRLERVARSPSVQFSERPPVAGGTKSASGDSSSPQSSEAAGGERASYAAGANLRAAGPNAFLANRRDVERSARLVLATEPSELRAAAARVFDTVHSFDGIVLRSSISAGDEAEASAAFHLLIPSGKLGDALAGFSEIAEVRSRQESTGDVTGRTTGVEERIRDSRATIESLLAELASSGTEAERSVAESRLRSERRQLAALRSGLQSLERRVNLSRVSLRIESGPAGTSADDGSWGISEAIEDAGRILGIAAGVTLIGLAVVAPLALIAALGWLGWRVWVKRRREDALG